jgi:hypothetical protein
MPFLKMVDAPLPAENSKGMTTGVTQCSKRGDSTVPTYIGIWNDSVSYLQGGGGAPTICKQNSKKNFIKKKYATWNHVAPCTIHEIIEEFYYDNNTTIGITKNILLYDSI